MSRSYNYQKTLKSREARGILKSRTSANLVMIMIVTHYRTLIKGSYALEAIKASPIANNPKIPAPTHLTPIALLLPYLINA
jgi:hypothetical protein